MIGGMARRVDCPGLWRPRFGCDLTPSLGRFSWAEWASTSGPFGGAWCWCNLNLKSPKSRRVGTRKFNQLRALTRSHSRPTQRQTLSHNRKSTHLQDLISPCMHARSVPSHALAGISHEKDPRDRRWGGRGEALPRSFGRIPPTIPGYLWGRSSSGRVGHRIQTAWLKLSVLHDGERERESS